MSALATDVLTENVFIITEDHSHVQVKTKLIILLYSPEETWPYVYQFWIIFQALRLLNFGIFPRVYRYFQV